MDAIVRVRKESDLPVLANITRLWHGDTPQEACFISRPPLRVLMCGEQPAVIMNVTPRPSESFSDGLGVLSESVCRKTHLRPKSFKMAA